MVIETDRLILRPWRTADHAPFGAMNTDPEVMRHFPSLMTRAQSDTMAVRLAERMDRQGFGLYAVEVRGGAPFVGYVGLQPVVPPHPAAPATEIGWRLARHAWGRGYATEAARACLDLAFDRLGLDEVVSFTAIGNLPSQAVMQRIGLRRDPARDFEHPALPVGDVLRPHVFYSLRRTDRQPASDAAVTRAGG